MFTIDTYLDRSTVHGIGVFTGQDLAAGQVIWQFNPLVDLVFSPEKWREVEQHIAPQSFAMLQRYAYKENGSFHLCLDNAQFMNHCDANANVANDRDTNTMFAKIPLKKGEELLCNYFEYSDDDDFHLEGIRGR
ncbi:SET domain-containing protein [Thiovibrio sp. JS02]